MSFGFSPTDVAKLIEISTRVYIAFKDANENSEAQVEALVREFQAFAQCLLELDELMKEFGKPLPFPVDEFRKTLVRCEESLKPYKENLVDKKMGFSKIVWTIKYIGKEKELEGLRKQITGHYQALHMCLSFLQLRLSLESTKREQRLLLEPRYRAMSVGDVPWYAGGAYGHSAPASPLALPATEESHPLYKDWEMFNRWLKTEDESLAQDLQLVRPAQGSDTPAATSGSYAGAAAALYRLRCEVEDAIMFEENRVKRTAVEKRSHLAPSDAMKQQVREMPQAPRQRTYTIDTENSSRLDPYEPHAAMSDSIATIRPGPSTPSPRTSISGSPQIEQEYFSSNDWLHSPTSSSLPQDSARSSLSTVRSSIGTASDLRLSPSPDLGISAADTTVDNAWSHTLRSVLSSASLATIALGDGALQWSSLCRKVQVERKSSERIGSRERAIFEIEECDIHWKYREDGGMSLRASYRSRKDGKARIWTMQDFPSLGPSIPLTTTIDGDVSIDFPRGSFGKLDKQWTDIKYTFANPEASAIFQTLLYTNNGTNAAELLFDRPIRTIASDKNRPECRGRNLRLWRRSEMRLESSGPTSADVLVLLFYTSFLEEKAHWVEEPHYAFEWLTSSTYTKTSDKLSLVFSKHPEKWTPDKLFQRRKSSQSSASSEAPTSPITAIRKDSMEIPGIKRSETAGSVASSAFSVKSSRSTFSRSKMSSRAGNLNAFGYTKLDIKFQSSRDRKAFLDVWQMYVKPLGTLA